MDPASGAIDSLLPKLEDLLLLCRGKLRKKARKELIFLKEKLTEIQLAFREVEDEPADQLKAQIKDWLRQARALSYCIEHVVDKFLARRLKAADPPAADLHELIGEVRFKWAIANASRQFAKEVETQRYRDRITELVNQHLDWSNTAGAAPSPRSGNASAMVANDHDGPVNELVDLDGRVEVLVSKILAVEEGEGQLKIASILGSAGVGKTTLVNRVYQQVNSQFECSAWVTVSQEPDIKHVLWTILCQISIQDYATFGSLSVEETVAEIRKALDNKRYFIVLEDLWDIKARETIKRALIDNSKGSAVLMTSHKVSVARYAGVKIYRLRPLSEDSSKQLFYRRLFGAGDNCPPDLVDISEKILEKCSGIPSSIINAANLLAGKTKEDWHNYLENPNAMRSRHLSYTGVPEHLKSCLLYVSMFQKGYEIRVDRLVSGWIAEGYIPEKANVTLQQQGEENVSELMERKLIEAVEVDADGKALSCRVNTMGHELIATLSAEENSVTILNKWEGQPLPQMVGRLAIQGQGHNANLPEDQISNVRSLIASDDANLLDGESGGGNVMSFLSNFVNLRVLELGGCSSLQNDHLKCIKSLLLLRYLVIGGDHITDIPKHIGYLKYLETLDLSASGVKELPATIVQARKLKCLRVNRHTKMPHGIGKMEALQELGDMNISNAELLRELSGLTNLKILRIVIWSWDDGYNDALLSYLGSPSMQKMKSLSIFTCCSLHIFEELKAEQAPRSLQKLEIRHSSFLSLPGWICSLENLSCLSIEVYKLSQEIIDILGKFQNLLALSLKSKQAPKGNFNDGFPKLTSLHFATNAAGRIFGPGAMLSLKRLDLSFQASRTEDVNHGFDFGLGNLSSLEHIRAEIVCFSANLEMEKRAKDAIMKAIYSGSSPGSEIHFDVPSELQSQQQSSTNAHIEQTESETNLHSPDQAEHDTIQQNQRSAEFLPMDPCASASHLSDNLQQHQSVLSPHLSSLQAGDSLGPGGVYAGRCGYDVGRGRRGGAAGGRNSHSGEYDNDGYGAYGDRNGGTSSTGRNYGGGRGNPREDEQYRQCQRYDDQGNGYAADTGTRDFGAPTGGFVEGASGPSDYRQRRAAKVPRGSRRGGSIGGHAGRGRRQDPPPLAAGDEGVSGNLPEQMSGGRQNIPPLPVNPSPLVQHTPQVQLPAAALTAVSALAAIPLELPSTLAAGAASAQLENQHHQSSSSTGHIEQAESQTHSPFPDQAEHGTIQQNQASPQFPTVDLSTSASHLSDNLQQQQQQSNHSSLQAGHGHLEAPVKILPISLAQFCDECGSPYSRATSKFCSKCGTKRLGI